MELTDSLKAFLKETAQTLKGHERRRFMAKTVAELGIGGQRRAERELGWNRELIRKGQREVTSGIICVDAFKSRGRKPTESRLPLLLEDLQAIVDSQSQIDPQFRTNRLYTRLSAAQVRVELMEQKGYSPEELPTAETIRQRLNELGYYPSKVGKTRPKKKIAVTEAIFEQLDIVKQEAQQDQTVLRLSLDAKAVVKIGPFSRGGTSRADIQGCDHDFNPKATITPYGIFLPQLDEVFLYLATSKVTSDFMADTLDSWWQSNRERFSHIQTLLIHQDNGPENHSRRTQFMKRMVEFANTHRLYLRLAYYPPYHSKYNPIERVWGILENHWNGSILDEIDTVVNFARTMRWMGQHPVVTLVNQTYQTGIKLTQKAMAEVETQIQRLTNLDVEGLPNLGKWFVDISYTTG
ncbi:MAG: ISAzo13 family transposase [Microcystaceae cyanobacterium]